MSKRGQAESKEPSEPQRFRIARSRLTLLLEVFLEPGGWNLEFCRKGALAFHQRALFLKASALLRLGMAVGLIAEHQAKQAIYYARIGARAADGDVGHDADVAFTHDLH